MRKISNSNLEKPTNKTLARDPGRQRRYRVFRRLQAGIAIGLIAGLIVTGLVLAGGLKTFEYRFGDLFYRPRVPSDQVVLIAVDDKTVDQYDWPIERITHSALLSALIRAQPRVIAFDFILPDPSSPAEDAFFAAIIQRADKIIQPVLGIEATRFPSGLGQFPAFDSLLRPAPFLRTANTTFAHTMIYPDPDGVVRRVPLAIDLPRQRYPNLGLAALALFVNEEPSFDLANKRVVLGDKHIPLDENGQLLINFVQHSSFQILSYSDVAQGRVDYNLLRDKIAIIGPMTKAVPESYSLPLGVGDARTFNIEIQADVIETLSSGNFLSEEELTLRIEFVLMLAFLAGATLTQFRWWQSATIMLGYFAIYLLIAFVQFDQGIIPRPLDMALTLLLVYVLAMLYRYISEERTRAFIGRIFLGSVSPESMDQVLAQYDLGKFSLDGGRREVTVLCASLRGISSLSEALAPQAVFEFLDKYAAHILEIVFRHGGSIHSQVGNTIFAMWNLPLDQPDHARRAVNAAFEIQRDASNWKAGLPQAPMVELDLGIATGAAITGHLSMSARAELSVIGDVVNLAERLSILASENQVLIDTATYDLLREELQARPIHTLRLRGKKEPLQVWQIQDTTVPTELPSQ